MMTTNVCGLRNATALKDEEWRAILVAGNADPRCRTPPENQAPAVSDLVLPLANAS